MIPLLIAWLWLSSIGLTAWLAQVKGRRAVAWLLLSLVLGPLGLLAMVGAPEVRK